MNLATEYSKKFYKGDLHDIDTDARAARLHAHSRNAEPISALPRWSLRTNLLNTVLHFFFFRSMSEWKARVDEAAASVLIARQKAAQGMMKGIKPIELRKMEPV